MSSGVCGFCATGNHGGCPRSYRPFFFEGKRLLFRDEVRVCPCPEHENDEENTSE